VQTAACKTQLTMQFCQCSIWGAGVLLLLLPLLLLTQAYLSLQLLPLLPGKPSATTLQLFKTISFEYACAAIHLPASHKHNMLLVGYRDEGQIKEGHPAKQRLPLGVSDSYVST